MVDPKVKQAVLDLISDYDRLGTLSVTTDTVAKALRLPRPIALKALNALMVEGRVEYARKNPRSAQPRFQLTPGVDAK